MAFTCTDHSTKILADMGFNLAAYPTSDIKPLEVLGRQNDKNSEPTWWGSRADNDALILGSLDKLILEPKPLPAVTVDQDAPDISKETTDDIDIGVGFSILGNFFKALGGGTLGASEQFTRAKSMVFKYAAVQIDYVEPLDVGAYLQNTEINSANPVIAQYLAGNGELFLITKIAKSKTFSVDFKDGFGNKASVDVPKILAVAADVQVKVDSQSHDNSSITFSGQNKLAFGFQCFKLGVRNGRTTLEIVPAGSIHALQQGPSTNEPVILARGSLLSVAKREHTAIPAHR